MSLHRIYMLQILYQYINSHLGDAPRSKRWRNKSGRRIEAMQLIIPAMECPTNMTFSTFKSSSKEIRASERSSKVQFDVSIALLEKSQSKSTNWYLSWRKESILSHKCWLAPNPWDSTMVCSPFPIIFVFLYKAINLFQKEKGVYWFFGQWFLFVGDKNTFIRLADYDHKLISQKM